MNTRWCAFFSFTKEGKCHIHDSKAKPTDTTGAVSGPVNCVKYDPNPDVCKAACDEIDGCNVAILDRRERRCYTYRVGAVPNKCDRNGNRWTYAKHPIGWQ